MIFENKETENRYNELLKKIDYFHVNYGYNHVITIEEVESIEEIINELKEKSDKE